jgi:hypothetical protein
VSNARVVSYATDQLPGGDRIVRSVGLARLGQGELCIRVSSRRDYDYDHRVMGVMNFIVDYIVNTGARIRAGESLEYGWTLLRFLERAPSLLEAHEIMDPFSDEAEPPVVPGIDRALSLAEASRNVMRRNRLTGSSDFPYRGKTAVTCAHLAGVPSRQLFIERYEPDKPRDSGWSITCGTAAKSHQTEDLRVEHLVHVGARRRFVVPYLTIPVGSAVAFDLTGATVFPAGKNAGQRDPLDPYLFEQVNLAG